MARSRRLLGTLGLGAVVAGGAALGFVAERRFVHERIAPASVPLDVPIGSLAGEVSAMAGPDGMRVVVETYGPSRPADDVTLVLAHGWICTGRVWHEQVAALAGRYRIVTYDQPGHGRTSAPASGRYDLDLLGDTLAAVVEHAAPGSGPLVVAGHSMGGMSVLNAVRRHPETFARRVAGAVLISTTSSAKAEKLSLEVGIRAVARLERGIRRVVPTLRNPRLLDASERLFAASSDLSYLLTRWTATGPQADPQVVAFTQQLALDSKPDVVPGLVEAVLGVDEDEALDCLLVPTTILVGTHDRLTPLDLSRRMAQRCGADLVELPEIGHMAPLEAGRAVNEVLAGHLDRVARDAGTAA